MLQHLFDMKYEPVFKFPYLNVFITDILFKGTYGKFNSIATIKNGKWELFIEKRLLNELSEKRFSEVLKNINFKEFEDKSFKLSKELNPLKDTKLENLSDSQFLEFLDKMFDVGGRFLDKKKLVKYIINMQHLKFELRKVLNEVWMGPASTLAKVLEQLVIRTKREDAVNLTLEEIKDLFKNKNIPNSQDRHVYSYTKWDEKNLKLIIFSGADGYRKIRELDKQIPKKEVIGTPACSGFARGRAKIIPLSMNPEQYLSKMERGDILVSDTTGPDLMPAIEKAAAIVTDEGGMMSHAAIISREFNIPCVVGTKYATEVFKDGDLVEVNANNGVVRKIEQ